jgi:regulator of sigma E protease
VALGVSKQFTVLTFQGLGKALAGLGGTIAGAITSNKEARQAAQTEASSQVSGPLGIFFIFKYGAELGWKFILMVVAIISLTLAIMNILPIPALDGGRLWLTLITRAIKKPLNPDREELINAIGFMTLMALIVLITVVDAKRFF